MSFFSAFTRPATLASRLDQLELLIDAADPKIVSNAPTADQTIAGPYKLVNAGAFATPLTGLTDGTMTPVNIGELRHVTYRWDWTNAMVAALAGSADDITICTIPAMAMVINALVKIKTAETSANALTVAVGRTAADYLDYIKASDAKAAADTLYGAAAGDRGTNLTGYDVPSGSAATAIKAHFVKSVTALSTVTTCSGSVYLELSLSP